MDHSANLPNIDAIISLVKELCNETDQVGEKDGKINVGVSVPVSTHVRHLIANIADVPPPPPGSNGEVYNANLIIDPATPGMVEKIINAVADARMLSNPALGKGDGAKALIISQIKDGISLGRTVAHTS